MKFSFFHVLIMVLAINVSSSCFSQVDGCPDISGSIGRPSAPDKCVPNPNGIVGKVKEPGTKPKAQNFCDFECSCSGEKYKLVPGNPVVCAPNSYSCPKGGVCYAQPPQPLVCPNDPIPGTTIRIPYPYQGCGTASQDIFDRCSNHCKSQVPVTPIIGQKGHCILSCNEGPGSGCGINQPKPLSSSSTQSTANTSVNSSY